MKTIIWIPILVAIVVGALAFYGGMKYNQFFGTGNRRAAGQGFMQGGATAGGALRGIRTGANFVNGDVIGKDEKSITLKMRDGGSKIIFFSDATEFSKFATGTVEDVNAGTSIMANGTTNADGSITAQTIQIRPQTASGTPGFGSGPGTGGPGPQ